MLSRYWGYSVVGMRIRNKRQHFAFVALVTGLSVIASLLVTHMVSPVGLGTPALAPALAVPLVVAPLVSYWSGVMMRRIHQLNMALAHELRHDPMTGLLRRAAFFEAFEDIRQPPSGALLMIDIDEFKRINDTYGHNVGDRVICAVGQTLREHFGGCGKAARFGGEEFVVFCPGESLEQVRERAENLRMDVMQSTIYSQDLRLKVSLSIGVAAWQQGSPVDEALVAADRAMYSAKRAGRNQVVLSA